jgi:hypothetical protein
MTQVRCPNCGSPVQAAVEQLLDVGQEPGAKARLLSGNFNQLRCPVCGYQGSLSTPLVYHDPDKQLLLTYVPVDLGLPKQEQERLVGSLINQAITRLPAEMRKAYLLQPQTVLTMQGLIERVLEADGITREELDAQKARIRLFESLLRTPDEQVEEFVREHDAELDEEFFQLASVTLQTTRDDNARRAAAARFESALAASSYGKRLQAQEAELRAAAESLQQKGERLTREDLLDMIVLAPTSERVRALVSLTRPGLDYAFFQLLSERIDAAGEPEKARLEGLRSEVLELTRQIDEVQEARAAQSAALLRSLMSAPDLDRAVRQAIPLADELFLGILQANLRAAEERGDQAALERLQQINAKIHEVVIESLPPGLKLAQQLLDTADDDQARELLERSAGSIDEALLSALMSTAQRLEHSGDGKLAERVRVLHRLAMRISMRAKMAKG